MIAASNLDWVIVRSGVLTNAGKRGQYRCGPRVGSCLWSRRVSRAQVADFMLDQLTSDKFLRATPGVIG